MQVILLENIIKLGKIGDLVKVKNGYARNFLLKNGKALRANKENINLVNKQKDELNKKNNEIKLEFVKISNKIKNKILKFKKEAKDNGDLYGSIKPKEISTTIEEVDKLQIKPSQIDLSSEIIKIGTYYAKVNLHAEIVATIHIEVVKQKEKN